MTSPASPVVPGARNVADLVSDAVSGCVDVAALSAGISGQVRSYLPGRNIPGIRISDDLLEVHIVAHYGSPLPVIAERIGEAVRPWLVGRELVVTVEDILLPGEELEPEPEPAVAEVATDLSAAADAAVGAVEERADASDGTPPDDSETSGSSGSPGSSEPSGSSALPDTIATTDIATADAAGISAPDAVEALSSEKPSPVVVLVVEPRTVVDMTAIRPASSPDTLPAAKSDTPSEPTGDPERDDESPSQDDESSHPEHVDVPSDPASQSDVRPNSPPPAH